MKARTNFALGSLVVIAMLTGCRNHSFTGGLTYLNRSEKQVWVERTEGVKKEYGAGILIPGANKGIIGYESPLPEKITVYWSFETGSSEQRTTLPVSPPPSKSSEMLIIFDRNQQWNLQWNTKNEK